MSPMADFPHMPLFVDAYLGDTMHLSLEEHGAYLKLLMIAWRTKDCALPDDDRRIATMLGVTAKRWTEILRPSIAPFWDIAEGRWTQKKLLKVRQHAESVSEQRKEAGGKRQTAKSLNGNGTAPANAPAIGPANAGANDPITKTKEVESYTEGKNLPTNTESHTRPEGGAKAVLWAEMKAWLGGKDPGRLIGAWCRDYGEGPVFAAYFKALKVQPAEPKSWMVDELKRSAGSKEVAAPKGDQLLLDKFERPKIERQARVEIAATGLDVYTAEGGRAVVARMREIADARS
jgi:uncharacterized protein YdaU (DUF1376 family)